jgi:hypothetical protein
MAPLAFILILFIIGIAAMLVNPDRHGTTARDKSPKSVHNENNQNMSTIPLRVSWDSTFILNTSDRDPSSFIDKNVATDSILNVRQYKYEDMYHDMDRYSNS